MNKAMFNKIACLLLALNLGCYPLFVFSLEQIEQKSEEKKVPKKYLPVIVEQYSHNTSYFTQGFSYQGGLIYEGTGLRSESKLLRYDLKSQKIDKQLDLKPQYFGEGITVLDDKIYQLTYVSRIGFVYDKSSLKQLATFRYHSEGWGLTNDGDSLIMSNGSHKLLYLNANTFSLEKTVQVKRNGRLQKDINELEYIDGLIYANIWLTDMIVQIDPATGEVVGEIDASGITKLQKDLRGGDVLNGIAWDEKGKRLLITGKHWSAIYHIELVPDSG